MGKLIAVKETKLMDGDTKYSRAIKIPQYEPKGVKPYVDALYNKRKYSELLKDICSASNITDEEKAFLVLAASRHIQFNYEQIANYYAHSNKEMQELMEKSALVIIDVDDAIAGGYVELSRRMDELVDEAKKRKAATNEG